MAIYDPNGEIVEPSVFAPPAERLVEKQIEYF